MDDTTRAAIADRLEVVAALLRPAPPAAPSDGWTDWVGGDQPEETYGKVVDVVLRDGYQMNGPADALIWADVGVATIARYRIAAVQPEA